MTDEQYNRAVAIHAEYSTTKNRVDSIKKNGLKFTTYGDIINAEMASDGTLDVAERIVTVGLEGKLKRLQAEFDQL